MLWDFAEASFVGGQAGDHATTLRTMARVVEWFSESLEAGGQVHSADAVTHPLPDQAASVWFTDPPYYDAVPYADLSDFFLVWLKRRCGPANVARSVRSGQCPVTQGEAVQDETKYADGRRKTQNWFEEWRVRSPRAAV